MGAMKEISVAELRQNPTAALNEVAAGEVYLVTRHRHAIARLLPVEEPVLVPLSNAVRSGPSRLSGRPRWRLKTAGSVDELIEDMKSQS